MPLTDSYFAEPLAKLFGDSAHGDELQVELCGVLKSGRTQLRVRVPTVAAAALAPVAGSAAAAASPVGGATAAAATAAAGPSAAELLASAAELLSLASVTLSPADAAVGGGAGGGGAGALCELLLNVGVAPHVASLLQELGLDAAAVCAAGAAHVCDLTSCSLDEARTIVMVAASLPTAPPPPRKSCASTRAMARPTRCHLSWRSTVTRSSGIVQSHKASVHKASVHGRRRRRPLRRGAARRGRRRRRRYWRR